MSQSALYSKQQAAKANLTLERLGLSSWASSEVKNLQIKVGAKADGWFGPKSIKAWKAWAKKHDPNPVTGEGFKQGHAIINGKSHEPPKGLKYVNHLEPGGIPAQLDDTSARKREVTQFILHRGWAGSYKPGRNFAAKTEETLDQRGLSTSHSMDIDGTIYQHFDPAIRRGRHATWHNVQSDSLDIGGPFEQKRTPAPGQEKMTFKAAIRGKDTPPLARPYGIVRCWSLTPEQEEALKLFIPWWCKLRNIPLTACTDLRCMRVETGSKALQDPVTNVKGVLAHGTVGGAGRRVDGFLPLTVLKAAQDAGECLGIRWRSAEDFFDT